MSEANSTNTVKTRSKRVDELGNPLPCSFSGCDRLVFANGFCAAHNAQNAAGFGLTPIHTKKRPAGTPPRIICDEFPCPVPNLIGPCHIFRGSKDTDGYGQVGCDGRLILVHRYIFEKTNGPIEDGKVIDHLCRVHACCNEDHLRSVTRAVNSTENSLGMGAVNKSKTHCKNGHPYDEENTYIRPDNGGRLCRRCRSSGKRTFNKGN